MDELAQTEVVQDTLKNIERVSAWPIEALNIALFALVLFVCWRYIRNVRTDFQKLQDLAETERRDYTAHLKSMLAENNRIVERNNVIFEKIEKRLERIEDGGN